MNKLTTEYKITAYDNASDCRRDMTISTLDYHRAQIIKCSLEDLNNVLLKPFTNYTDFKIERVRKYTSDGMYNVFCGKKVIAKSFTGFDGYEARILQGMPRAETWAKIFRDCPDFAKNNHMDINKVPRLFAE